MRLEDTALLAWRSLTAHRLRSGLTLLGIAVGIAAVILLTSIGAGLHRFVLQEFTQFGTHILEITPGRKNLGGAPAGLQSTVRPLTLEDVAALERLPQVRAVTPVLWSNAEVEANFAGRPRLRRTTVYGVGAKMPEVWQLPVQSGRFLPPDDAGNARALVVLGATLKRELFGHENALGARLRIGGMQFRVIGVMAPKGQVLGQDLDDTAYVPAARMMEILDREGLMQVNLTYRENLTPSQISDAVRSLLKARHGREDFTLTTQEDMLRALSKILDILTLAVGALGGISLLVGAVGIVTIMTIAVAERTNEIGLLKALGARESTILALFLGEAVVLALVGGVLGLISGALLAQLIHLALPALPVSTPWEYAALALLSSLLIGLAAGVLPARRAAGMNPVLALQTE